MGFLPIINRKISLRPFGQKFKESNKAETHNLLTVSLVPTMIVLEV